jgi:CBS domain-containing protein
MSIDILADWAPNLEKVIDRNFLTVPLDMPLLAVINLINQRQPNQVVDLDTDLPNQNKINIRTSCVLVTQGAELLGILTERDIVRLTAEQIDFSTVQISDVMIHPVITISLQSLQDISAVLFLFRRYRIRHIPVVGEQEQLIGVISHENVRQIMRPANLLQLRRVADVMTSQVIQAPLTASVLELARLMAEHRISCVVITQPTETGMDQPVGIVNERDIVQFQALKIDLHQTQAHTVMSTPLFILSPEDSLWTAHQEMQNRRVGRLVVSWNWGQDLGIVTQTSLLRVFDPVEMYGIIQNLEQTIQQLRAERSANQEPEQT